jgi:hypothetical protein
MATQTQSPTHSPASPPAGRAPRDVRRARRLFAAALLPVPAVAVAVLRLVWPAFSATDTASSLAAIADHPTAQEVVVWLGVVTMLTMVPAVLAVVRLARRHRPVLAMVAAGVNLVAYLGATPLFAGDLLAQVAARPEYDRAQVVPFIDGVGAHPASAVGLGLFVLGHILGMILLGAAVWRIVPRWASVALIVSQPLHFVAFVVLGIQPLDGLAWGLTAAGFVGCALTILRTPDSDWDLAPVRG